MQTMLFIYSERGRCFAGNPAFWFIIEVNNVMWTFRTCSICHKLSVKLNDFDMFKLYANYTIKWR